MNNNKEDKEKLLLQVNDKFQNYIHENFPELKKYSILNEILFYSIFGYYYYFGPIQDSIQNFLIVKYIISILVLRYVFNNLTNLTDLNKDEKKTSYFQLNSKLAIFIIMILFLSKTENTVNLNSNITLAIIIAYTLLTTTINMDTTTVDNIMTTVLVLYIFSLKLLN